MIKACNKKLLARINLIFFFLECTNVGMKQFLILRMQARHRSLPQAQKAAIGTLGHHSGAILA